MRRFSHDCSRAPAGGNSASPRWGKMDWSCLPIQPVRLFTLGLLARGAMSDPRLPVDPLAHRHRPQRGHRAQAGRPGQRIACGGRGASVCRSSRPRSCSQVVPPKLDASAPTEQCGSASAGPLFDACTDLSARARCELYPARMKSPALIVALLLARLSRGDAGGGNDARENNMGGLPRGAASRFGGMSIDGARLTRRERLSA